MGYNMEGSTPSERDVLVSIPTHDDDGNPITDDMLSTGGARIRGPFVKQYRNPRPVPSETRRSAEEEAQHARTEREARLSETREARRREEVRAQRNADNQEFARWVYYEVLVPAGKWWWATRGPEDPSRVRAFAAKHFQRVTVKHAPSKVEASGETRSPADPTLHVVEDAPLAPVAELDDYRRSA